MQVIHVHLLKDVIGSFLCAPYCADVS